MKVLAVIGARLNSSRLPKKHFLPLAGRPLIAHIFARLTRVHGLDRIVLATTNDAYNRPLAGWCRENLHEVYSYGGDVNDLVGRVHEVVESHDADAVLYVCGDSPLIEPSTMSKMIDLWRADPSLWITYPTRKRHDKPYIHEGFELFSREAWNELERTATSPQTREHVGASLRPRFKQIPHAHFEDHPTFYRLNHRISVDTVSDYLFMKTIYERWYETHDLGTIVDLAWVIEKLAEDPELRNINAHVRQKTVDEISPKVLVRADHIDQVGDAVDIARRLQDNLAAGIHLSLPPNTDLEAHPILPLLDHTIRDPAQKEPDPNAYTHIVIPGKGNTTENDPIAAALPSDWSVKS